METSDSEYFESADEDFESEDELNKNKFSIKSNNSVHATNLSKEISKVHTLSDIKENKKETIESENVTSTNEPILQGKVTKNNSVSDSLAKTTLLLPANEKNTFQNDREADPHADKNDGVKKNTDDNLWNEGEGWGEDFEGDLTEPEVNIDKVDSGNTLSDKIKISNQRAEAEMPRSEQPVKEEIAHPFTDKVKESNERLEVSSKRESEEDKNMWENEEWETWESVDSEKVQENTVKSNLDNSNANSSQLWKGWGNWGVTSILSTATQGVSSLTNTVSQGLSNVLETSIGAPEPEKLAVLNQDIEKKLSVSTETKQDEEHENKNILGFDLSNIGSLVSGVSKLVETTGTKVISGGLDTLETIGKKTMEVIQDGDPGLKKKRAFLNLEGEKPVLSQVLREAKEKAEQENKTRQEKHLIRKVNYESLFDDHQGLVHLEALEMLSKQCDMKLQLLIESSSGDTLTEIQETLDQVKELSELPDEEEDEQISMEELKDRLKSAVKELDINITYDKLISMWEETEHWLSNINLNICDENEIHQQAVETLAQLTAIAVEQFHKAGELLLIKDHHSTADEADSLVQLTTTLTSLIGIVAAKFSDKMNSKATENSDKENINSLITNIFFEAANSSSYIQDAFQLLVPVLQMGAV